MFVLRCMIFLIACTFPSCFWNFHVKKKNNPMLASFNFLTCACYFVVCFCSLLMNRSSKIHDTCAEHSRSSNCDNFSFGTWLFATVIFTFIVDDHFKFIFVRSLFSVKFSLKCICSLYDTKSATWDAYSIFYWRSSQWVTNMNLIPYIRTNRGIT